MQSLLQVDEEVGAEEPHPELHTSQNQAGARLLRKVDSLSSELASSEQRQGPPKRDLYKEEGMYKPLYMLPGYTPSPAATVEQSYSGGALDAEAKRGRGSSRRQLSSSQDWDTPLFRGPLYLTLMPLLLLDPGVSWDQVSSVPRRVRTSRASKGVGKEESAGSETLSCLMMS